MVIGNIIIIIVIIIYKRFTLFILSPDHLWTFHVHPFHHWQLETLDQVTFSVASILDVAFISTIL